MMPLELKALTKLGSFYFKGGEQETAKDYFYKALPDADVRLSAKISSYLVTILCQTGQLNEANKHFNNLESYLTHALPLKDQERIKTAIAIYKAQMAILLTEQCPPPFEGFYKERLVFYAKNK